MSLLKSMLFWISVLILATWGCRKEKTAPNPDVENCYSGKVIKTVTNQTGRVFYDSTEKRYVVFVSIPGTYDSVDAGYICDTLTGFKELKGLEMINFDGKYYTYSGNLPPQIAGTEYYFLKITRSEIIQ